VSAHHFTDRLKSSCGSARSVRARIHPCRKIPELDGALAPAEGVWELQIHEYRTEKQIRMPVPVITPLHKTIR
jgi:hypothetical protein